MSQIQNLKKNIIEVAEKAGEILLNHYGSLKVSNKEDGSPVTNADIASHEYLYKELKNRFSLPVVSEEGSHSQIHSESFFLVDPLDGTKDFIEKNGEFSVCIALIKKGVPVAGVIHVPYLKETYYAELGHGCEIFKNGKKIHLTLESRKASILIRSRHHHCSRADYFALKNKITEKVAVGSALKFAYLVSGKGTVYPRFEGSKEWDIAAGHIILKEAGGKIISLETGKEPVYGRAPFKNAAFVAFAPGVDVESFILEKENE